MANPVNPGHPGEFLSALAVILPVGTPIATVLIQKGTLPLDVDMPVLQLNCPETKRTRKANHAKQAVFTIHGLYYDRWETDARTFEQILADMSEALHTAADNVDADPSLGLGQTIAGESISIQVDSPIDTKDLGVAVVAGLITIEVKGPWYQGS